MASQISSSQSRAAGPPEGFPAASGESSHVRRDFGTGSSRIGAARCTVNELPVPRSVPNEVAGRRGGEGAIGTGVNQAGDLWTRCTGSLREQVSETTWQLWLSGIEPLTFNDGIFVLSVPNPLIRERVESRYLSMIENTLADEVGSPVRGRLELKEPARGAPRGPSASGTWSRGRGRGCRGRRRCHRFGRQPAGWPAGPGGLQL